MTNTNIFFLCKNGRANLIDFGFSGVVGIICVGSVARSVPYAAGTVEKPRTDGANFLWESGLFISFFFWLYLVRGFFWFFFFGSDVDDQKI